MIVPPDVEQTIYATHLGRMVCYSPTGPLWKAPQPQPDADSATPHKPTLVFLHGFGGGSSAYEWSKVYPAFASDYRVLAPDLIGWGRSDHPQRDYQVDDYIQTILEFLQQVSQQANGESLAVVASSFTGAIAIRAAIQQPQLFRCLILTTPAGLSDFGQDYTQNLFTALVKTPVLDRLLYFAGVANPEGIRSFLNSRQFVKPERIYPEIIDAYLASAKQPNAEYAALSFVRGDLCFDLARYISNLTTPTAILWGRGAQYTGPEIGRKLAQLNPTAIKRYVELQDVGLTPQLELPAVTIGLFRQFLADLVLAV
ncbi:MAG: alpha/beta hydrolase [Elainellaceae cyanobacterium]